MALIVGGDARAPGRYLVAIDALRGEYYVGLYEVAPGGEIVERERARLVPATDVDAIAVEFDATVIGPTSRAGGITAAPRARAVLGSSECSPRSAPRTSRVGSRRTVVWPRRR